MICHADAEPKVSARIVDRHRETIDDAETCDPFVKVNLRLRLLLSQHGFAPRKRVRREACDRGCQIMPDIVVLLILTQPFNRPGIEEELPGATITYRIFRTFGIDGFF
jgi:hypothetical protein